MCNEFTSICIETAGIETTLYRNDREPLWWMETFGADGGSRYFPFVRSEKLFIQMENSLEDRKESFHGQLTCEIKKKLWSGRREDPDMNIDLNVDQDVFMEGLEKYI